MNPSKKIILYCILVLCVLNISAQKYQSDVLRKIARKVTLSVNTDGVAGYYDAGNFHGMPIEVGIDAEKTIFHIGYKLFAPEVKSLYPSDVYDFVERYLLELDCLHSDEMLSRVLADDKVIVEGGSLDNLRRIKPSTAFTINRNDKFYMISWTQNNSVLLSLAFPIQFELLLGMPKDEIEKKFKDIILNCKEDTTKNVLPEVKLYKDSCYRSEPNTQYYIESFDNASYYKKVGDSYIPIYDTNKKWYSAANLFQGIIDDSNDYTLYVQQNLYGYETTTYTVPLKKWLDYCKQEKLTVYFGIEEERVDGLKALLIAQSNDMGFNHMMSIIIPDNFVSKKNAVLKATVNAFIPIQNVKDLYQKYTKTTKKKI